MNARKIPDIDVKWLRSYFSEIKSVFSRIDLIKILEDLKEQKVLGRSFKYGRFVDLSRYLSHMVGTLVGH